MRAKDREGHWFIDKTAHITVIAYIIEYIRGTDAHPFYDTIALTDRSSLLFVDQGMDVPDNWFPYQPTKKEVHRALIAAFEEKI
jgi:hypothetical protein